MSSLCAKGLGGHCAPVLEGGVVPVKKEPYFEGHVAGVFRFV
jgi:hypothetical protein